MTLADAVRATVRATRHDEVAWGLALKIGNHVATALLALWGVVSIVFIALDATGAPLTLFLTDSMTHEDMNQLVQNLGFDRPLHQRYFDFLSQVFTGQFPNSLQYPKQSALEIVLVRAPASLQLGLSALILGTFLGLAGGYVAAFTRSRIVRGAIETLNAIFLSIPAFVLGFGLIIVFSLWLRWLPPNGGDLRAMVLPATTLSLLLAVPISRVFTTTLLETVDQDYVQTAVSTGRTWRSIRFINIVPNAFSPVLQVIGIQLAGLLGGTVVVENLFQWPGIGRVMTTATANQDYPVIIAGVLIASSAFIVVSLLTNIAQTLIDPRTRAGGNN